LRSAVSFRFYDFPRLEAVGLKAFMIEGNFFAFMRCLPGAEGGFGGGGWRSITVAVMLLQLECHLTAVGVNLVAQLYGRDASALGVADREDDAVGRACLGIAADAVVHFPSFNAQLLLACEHCNGIAVGRFPIGEGLAPGHVVLIESGPDFVDGSIDGIDPVMPFVARLEGFA
jgi:hypothetical protein